MTFGKNKRIFKKRGKTKKVLDPFEKKEWYDVKAPSVFTHRNIGKTPVNRTVGTKLAIDGLKGRVFEVNLADLQGSEDLAYRKVLLKANHISGKSVLTTFWGMDFTTDKLRSLIRKWQTLIEANTDITTSDGYNVRLFAIGFTKLRTNQVKKTWYAQSSQVRAIRRRMVEIMQRKSGKSTLADLVKDFITETFGKKFERDCNGIFPLINCYVRKVKILRPYPRMDLTRVLSAHGTTTAALEAESAPVEEEEEEDTGAPVGDVPVEESS